MGPTVEVSGKVTLDGAPVSKGSVWFTSARSGSGFQTNLQADGTYSMKLLDAKPGDVYGVHFDGRKPEEGEPVKLDGAGLPVVVPPAVPGKYREASQSGLTVTVSKDGSQTFDFALKSK